ncbi:MAG: GNAT family N-acetyltransferase [Methylomonas sp.]|nr:GNAT family N-acetyltransferase [Methylomonas sp.]
MLTVEALEDFDSVIAIMPEWHGIWIADPLANVFCGSEWFAIWWQSFAIHAEQLPLQITCGRHVFRFATKHIRPYVLVVRNGSQCVGVLPLVAVQTLWRRLPARILLSPLNSQCERSGLVRSLDTAEVMIAIVGFLRQQSGWDVLLLDGIALEGQVVKCLRAATQTMGLAIIECESAWKHYYLPIRTSWDEYAAAKGYSFRKPLRRAERNLAELGELSYECYDWQTQGEKGLELFMDVDLHSWKMQRGESVADVPVLRAFYRNLFSQLSQQGHCQIRVLRIAGVAVAALFCLMSKGVVYGLKISFRQQYTSAKLGPGVILMNEFVKTAHESGLTAIDFMGEPTFLRRWVTTQQVYGQACLFAGHSYGRCLSYVDNVSRQLKPRLDRLKLTKQYPQGGSQAPSSQLTEDIKENEYGEK